MQYRFVNARIKRSTNAYTSCENVVKIGLVTLEFKKGVCGIFAKSRQKTGQKLVYPTKYLSNYWIYFSELSALVVIYVRFCSSSTVVARVINKFHGLFAYVEIGCFHSSLWPSEI